MTHEELVQLYNSLNRLDSNELTLVTYYNNSLELHQVGVTVSLKEFELYFIPNRKFKHGLLSQFDLMETKSELIKIMQDRRLSIGQLLPVPVLFGTDFYALSPEITQYPGPIIRYRLKYLSISNWFLCKLLMKLQSESSRRLFKLSKQLLNIANNGTNSKSKNKN